MKSLEIIYTQLLALRLQVDSLIQALENCIEDDKLNDKPECIHPQNMRLSLNTMGDDRDKWQCKKCGKKFIDDEQID